MESNCDENSAESFLKIDTIWSEAEENFESIAIKEEIVSDIEPEFYDDVGKNEDEDVDSSCHGRVQSDGNEKNNCDSSFSSAMTAPFQFLRKRTKSKSNQTLASEESSLTNDPKSSCLHETKSFKIVNRRLRCGDCRSLVCPECFKIMFSTIHNHFLGFDTSNYSLYSCKFCCFPFQSVCALQAHIRIHTMETPYVCPDCGLMYSNAYFLILHLINKCFHVYKIVSYKCQNCPGAYFTSDTFLQHIQDSHLSSLFRCSYCSLLFDSYEELNSHMDSIHQKQKVQYLNYFRCTLCSDMVIPSFMYEKHIDQHRENSDSYEVEYRCLCGDVYSLIGAFRAHIEFCDKKGILPPQWGFLQKNLKTQDVMPIENLQGKEDPLAQGSHPQSGVGRENCQSSKPVFCRNNEQRAENGEPSTGEVSGSGKDNSSDKKENSVLSLNESKASSDHGRDSSTKLDETVLNNKKYISKLMSNGVEVICSSRTQDGEDLTEDKPGSTQAPKSSATVEEGKIEVSENGSIPDGEKEIRDVENERKETDGESSKIFYDYIPCDHMGYVKTQGPKALRDHQSDSAVAKEKSEDPSEVSNNYRIVMELDEKTGLLISKKVPVENSEEEDEEEEENANLKENYCEDEAENNSNGDDPFQKFHPNEKGKIKLGNSFFTCPFCIVLFPKHSSTFQQFRLHLEYYHADAALNIVVNNEERSAETDSTPSKANDDSPGDETKKTHLPKLGFCKTQSNGRKKSNRKRKQCAELDSASLESEDCSLENKPEVENLNEKKESDANEGKLRCDEDEKENQTKESNRMTKKSNLRRGDVYWTVKLSVKSGDAADEEKGQTDMGNGRIDLEGPENGGKQIEEKHEETFANQPDAKRVGIVQRSDCKSGKKIIFGTKLSIGRPKEDKNLAGEQNKESSLENSNDSSRSESKEVENSTTKKEKRNNCSGSAEKKTGQSASDLDEEWDNSKDSSGSNVSEMEFSVPGKEEKSEPAEDGTTRPKSIEKSRRESEVWSEFYESLQLAEKLKKSKKKKQQSQVEAKKKSSTLADYSAKRVVKKPKRYRETSESEYSFEEMENSESEAELATEHKSSAAGEEKTEVDEEGDFRADKKQILLSKLKNVDQKLVDYLFDVITRKEKCLELYKKHSSLRASRYSQDLRSYRKKVLNGIKLRGRPLKLLRYQKAAKKNQSMEAFKEFGYQRSQKKNPDLQGSKASEKKRGRPRKIMESGKLKERRRSDKEVDFIEKNFEREESGSSPSKRKRKLSSKLQYYKKINLSDEKDDFSSGQVITSKATDSGKKFNCAVCKEAFPEQTDFREHIVAHRLEENTYQCMECGECFVVRPSLEKHLHAFHKIKNTDRYIAENECCNPKKEPQDGEEEGEGEGEGDGEALKENQCKVCRDQFERAIDLTKHFRIHGMAFLREFKRDGKVKLSA